MNTSPPPQFSHQSRINNAEFKTKLVPHLISPLDLQRRGYDYENLSSTVTDDEFKGPVNLGDPRGFTIREVAEKVVEMTGSRSKLFE